MRSRWPIIAAWSVACQPSRLPDPDAAMFARLDADGSGVLAGDELAGLDDHARRDLDRNQSGDIDTTELSAYLARPPHSVLRMRASQRGKARRVPPKQPRGREAGPPPPEGP